MRDCIESSDRTTAGYGRVRVNGKRVYAHRQVMIDAGHDIFGKLVMHICDNPPCINIDHLRVGTHGDNMRDMYNKKRRKIFPKLTPELAEQIRAEPRYYGCQQGIADKYGISRSMVSRIFSREYWH